jgi:hypothetical protein
LLDPGIRLIERVVGARGQFARFVEESAHRPRRGPSCDLTGHVGRLPSEPDLLRADLRRDHIDHLPLTDPGGTLTDVSERRDPRRSAPDDLRRCYRHADVRCRTEATCNLPLSHVVGGLVEARTEHRNEPVDHLAGAGQVIALLKGGHRLVSWDILRGKDSFRALNGMPEHRLNGGVDVDRIDAFGRFAQESPDATGRRG